MRKWKSRSAAKGWLTRKKDGRHFIADRPGRKLPKLNVRLGSKVRSRVITVDPNKLLFRERFPVNIEPRIRYFMQLYQEGYPIAPIHVYRTRGGRYRVIDGHARSMAFQRLGLNEIQAVVETQPLSSRFGKVIAR